MEGIRQRRFTATPPGEVPVEQPASSSNSFRTGSSSDEVDEDVTAALNGSLDNPIADRSELSPDKSHAPRRAKSGAEVRQDESKLRKIAVRIVFGAGMFAVFCTLVSLGHTWICGLIALIEMLVFRELVRVRYSAYYERIQDTIPLFRTTQWLWFAVAIFYTYGAFLSEVLQKNQSLHYMLKYMQYFPSISFLLYSGTFVLTISTLQRGKSHLGQRVVAISMTMANHRTLSQLHFLVTLGTVKFQLNQLCWTVLVRVGTLFHAFNNCP